MRALLLALLFAPGSATLIAQTGAWQPSPGHTHVSIFACRGARCAVAAPEVETTRTKDHFVAGRPWTCINVLLPTMKSIHPIGKNTGTAVVVFPGGGYQILAIDLEASWVIGRLPA